VVQTVYRQSDTDRSARTGWSAPDLCLGNWYCFSPLVSVGLGHLLDSVVIDSEPIEPDIDSEPIVDPAAAGGIRTESIR